MNKNIQNYINAMFEEIPYSKASYEAKEKITDKLNEEYIKATKDTKNNAFEKVTSKYNTLYKLASLANYAKEDVDKWNNKKDAIDIEVVKKELKQEKKYNIMQIILILIAFIGLYNVIVTVIYSNKLVAVISPLLLTTILSVFIIRRHLKHIKENKHQIFSIDALIFLRKSYDKYSKKASNSLFIGISVLFFYIINIINLSIFSKPLEVVEFISLNTTIIELVILIIYKNIMITRFIRQKLDDKVTNQYRKNIIYITIFSFAYWLVACLIMLLFKFKYYTNFFLASCLIYVLISIIYNLKIRKKATYQNITINKKRIAVYSFIILLCSIYSFLAKDVWLVQPYINSVPNIYEGTSTITYNDDTGVYTITKDTDDFKILQLTDIHLGGGVLSYEKDLKALHTVYDLIEYTKPDLVVVTGDLTFPMGIMSFSINNYVPVMQFASFMRNLGVPWAFTYGNHDTESMAKYSSEDLNELYKSLSYKTSKTLLYPYKEADISGRNNQYIEIRNSDGTLNQLLFLIDSNAYTGEGINKYDYIHDDQVAWYKSIVLEKEKEAGYNVPSMMFFHIPIEQYKTAYELYEEGSDEVTYFFGSNDEKMIDKVCTSDYPSKIFDTALELGSTKAIFCGHDHYNNMSLEYKGIRLTYGMSVDYLAMPGIANDTKQRGGTLITLHNDSSFDIKQIPYESIK